LASVISPGLGREPLSDSIINVMNQTQIQAFMP